MTSLITRCAAGAAIASIAFVGIGASTASAQTPQPAVSVASAVQPVGQETLTFTNNSHVALVLHYSVMGEGHPQEKTVKPGESWELHDWVGNPRSVYHFVARTAGDFRDAFSGQIMYNRGQGFVGFVFSPGAITQYKFVPAGVDGARFSVSD